LPHFFDLSGIFSHNTTVNCFTVTSDHFPKSLHYSLSQTNKKDETFHPQIIAIISSTDPKQNSDCTQQNKGNYEIIYCLKFGNKHRGMRPPFFYRNWAGKEEKMPISKLAI
jgi:hypothetical protein